MMMSDDEGGLFAFVDLQLDRPPALTDRELRGVKEGVMRLYCVARRIKLGGKACTRPDGTPQHF